MIHHIAIATKDPVETHRFLTEAVGFDLLRTDVVELPTGGWVRESVYNTGDRSLLIAVDIHDPSVADFRTGLSSGVGLPSWVNHVAFGATNLDDLDERRRRLLRSGHGCVLMDHGHAIALYVDDPGGTMLEFTTWLDDGYFDAALAADALDILRATCPNKTIEAPQLEFHDPTPDPQPSIIIEIARSREIKTDTPEVWLHREDART
jgi:catechol 2,3-dioxygenase-like lactoylglutathione lyase family enzyme